MTTTTWKVYESNGQMVAACRDASTAAAVAAMHGTGSKVVWRHRSDSVVVWTEGKESIRAVESLSDAEKTMWDRRHAYITAKSANTY